MVKLILLGHGSSKHPDSSRSVREHAEILSHTGQFSHVSCAFLKEEPFVEHALDDIKDERVVIVPDFLAEGYFTRQVIPTKLGEKLNLANVSSTPPVGTHPMVAELIEAAAKEVLGEWDMAQTSLLVIGHGSGKNPCSKQSLLGHLQQLRDRSDFAQIADLWLEEAPLVGSWADIKSMSQVIVIPYLLNDGQHGGWDIPKELGLAVDENIHDETHQIKGCELRLTPALGKSPKFAELVLQLAAIWGQAPEQ